MGDGKPIGHLGGDRSALQLTPLIRAWPGESQHSARSLGLECLRAVGTDTALMQLNGIAQKLKFKGLKRRRGETWRRSPRASGLTREQLEDRIVPDCDLDERGTRIFDFGPRQFRFVLGPQMKPMVTDDDGKMRAAPAQADAKDDADSQAAAVEDWKLLKKTGAPRSPRSRPRAWSKRWSPAAAGRRTSSRRCWSGHPLQATWSASWCSPPTAPAR